MKKYIYETGTGWITPSGKTIACNMYDHFHSIMNYPEVPDMTDLANDVQDAEDACQELCDADEHPEWHSYEMAENGAKWEAYNRLLEAGFIRVGLNRQDHVLEFEGKKEMHQTIKQLLKDWNAAHPQQQYEFTHVFTVWNPED